jgi:hypothetical protein
MREQAQIGEKSMNQQKSLAKDRDREAIKLLYRSANKVPVRPNKEAWNDYSR